MAALKRFRKSIKYSLIIVLIRFSLLIVKLLPWQWTSAFCARLGIVAFAVLKKEREKAISNLSIAYGHEKSIDEIRQMAREVFANLGRSFAEAAIKLDVDDKEAFFSNVEVEGLEHARAAFERGNGVINIVPHLGCWEAASKAYTLLGFSAGAVAKPLKNKRLNDWVMKKRTFMDFVILPRGSSYKTILAFIKQNNSLGMLIDQDTSVKGVFVDFYGKPAYTPVGAAMLALDSDATSIVASYVRTSGNKYKFIFGKPMEVVRTGNRQEELQINTERFHQAAETHIKQYPTQWVWMHERWKTTPEKIEARERDKQEQRKKRREEKNA
ncbi:MAG: lysophospholipid acyltransferase family protein [Cyclobacteriaceae bacterium]|nr:lysophospholipid acyltransferase family protein [Cyclobacteriaceae bacterium]